jgi:uncharacterized protein YbjT (DUF2867 family)
MILIIGATGALGGTIARALLQKGEEVRVLVRSGSSPAPLAALGAELAYGDLKEPASLALACEGVDTVITTANSAQRGGADTVDTVDRDGNRNLIDAAKAAHVRHFIFISALGASEESPMTFMRAKAETERYLRQSRIAYTILQPNVFMDVWIPMIVGSAVQADRPVTLAGEGQRKHSMISSADVAAFAVACANNPAAIDRTIPLGGPEALSWRDILASCERAVGHPIAVRSVTPGESLPGLPAVVSDLATALEHYDSPVDMADTAAAFGIRLTPVEQYSKQALGSNR